MRRIRRKNNDGVALVVVLGLLAVLTLLAVAFAIAMRVERMAARNYANMVKAKHLVRTCLVQAMQEVNASMTDTTPPRVYPNWGSTHAADAMSSVGSTACDDLLAGEMMRAIPGALSNDAQTAASSAQWMSIQDSTGEDIGRVAFLVVNTSGLLDANLAGGINQDRRVGLDELDLKLVDDITDTNAFYFWRDIDRRYETVQEIAKLNPGVGSVQTLFPYSFDPQRDVYFYTDSQHYDSAGNHPKIDPTSPPTTLGQRTAALTNKFNINSITNYASYSDPDYDSYTSDPLFMQNYFEPLKAILIDCGFINFSDTVERPVDVAWNIVNYLDADRIPHAGEDFPYTHTEGGEPLPLINEIVFFNESNNWHIAVEVWYPFAPIPIEPEDKFTIRAGIYYDRPSGASMSTKGTIAAGSDILSANVADEVFDGDIKDMIFATDNEYKVYDFYFTPPGGVVDRDNPIYFYCQIRKEEDNGEINPVDDAPGYSSSASSSHKRVLFPLGASNMKDGSPYTILTYHDEGRGYSVCDPRSNGQVKYWTTRGKGWTLPKNGYDYPPNEHTLGDFLRGTPEDPNLGTNQPSSGDMYEGAYNDNCGAYSGGRSQGLPIFAYNGPMTNIAELGNIFRSNLDDEYVGYPDYWYWQTINLMHANEGAKLVDVLSVRDWEGGQGPQHGLININTSQKDVLRALFCNMEIGAKDCGIDIIKLRPFDVEVIVDKIVSAADRPWHTFQDMFTDDGQSPGSAGFDEGGGYRDGYNEVAKAIRAATRNAVNAHLGRPLTDHVGDVYKEDPFRKICELITFRQNMFTIALAAQALAPAPPDGSPAEAIAEKRAIATVYRDAFTSRYFIRSFKWIAD